MARTQQQRREETVARLLDASIAAIVEVGYARASAAEITKRAGVSVGALFRHFETMGDFMAATAHEVLRRQLDLGTKAVAEIPATLQDVLIEYGAKIYDTFRGLPGADTVPENTLAALVATLINTFDGAAIVRAVVPAPEIDAQQITLLASLLNEAYGF
jgi:AcrR family transcriptional regulator